MMNKININLKSAFFLPFMFVSFYACSQDIIISAKQNDPELSAYLFRVGEISSNDKALIFEDSLYIHKKFGLYQFGVMGFHQKDYLYYIDKKGRKVFIYRYDFNAIYNKLRSEPIFLNLEDKEQLMVIQKILDFLLQRIIQLEIDITKPIQK